MYDEWDTNKLIRGLLLQPGIQRAWDAILATGPIHHCEEFVWDRRTIEETQYRFEMGPSPVQSAETLAMAAYKAGKLKTESPQPASTLSVTAARDEGVETHFGTPDIMLHSLVSRSPSAERIPTCVASSDTSVANSSSAYSAAANGHMFDEVYNEADSSEGQAHMPNGTPSPDYDGWLGLDFRV